MLYNMGLKGERKYLADLKTAYVLLSDPKTKNDKRELITLLLDLNQRIMVWAGKSVFYERWATSIRIILRTIEQDDFKAAEKELRLSIEDVQGDINSQVGLLQMEKTFKIITAPFRWIFRGGNKQKDERVPPEERTGNPESVLKQT